MEGTHIRGGFLAAITFFDVLRDDGNDLRALSYHDTDLSEISLCVSGRLLCKYKDSLVKERQSAERSFEKIQRDSEIQKPRQTLRNV